MNTLKFKLFILGIISCVNSFAQDTIRTQELNLIQKAELFISRDLEPVGSYNYGITPIQLDSISFYSIYNLLLESTNLKFTEVTCIAPAGDFKSTTEEVYLIDDVIEGGFLVFNDVSYESTTYRWTAEYMDNTTVAKFIYYYLGVSSESYPKIHVIMGTNLSEF